MATASAQPMSNSRPVPTLKPGAHFQTAQNWLIAMPIPKEELTSPHYWMSMMSGDMSGSWLGSDASRKAIHERSAITLGAAASLSLSRTRQRIPRLTAGKAGAAGECMICVPICRAAMLPPFRGRRDLAAIGVPTPGSWSISL